MPKSTKKPKEPSYASYAAKILKQVHGKNELTVSNHAMQAVCMILGDIEDKLSSQAVKLAAYQKKGTIMGAHVKAATMMRLPPELCKHAVTVGENAVHRYTNHGITTA